MNIRGRGLHEDRGMGEKLSGAARTSFYFEREREQGAGVARQEKREILWRIQTDARTWKVLEVFLP